MAGGADNGNPHLHPRGAQQELPIFRKWGPELWGQETRASRSDNVFLAKVLRF